MFLTTFGVSHVESLRHYFSLKPFQINIFLIKMEKDIVLTKVCKLSNCFEFWNVIFVNASLRVSLTVKMFKLPQPDDSLAKSNTLRTKTLWTNTLWKSSPGQGRGLSTKWSTRRSSRYGTPGGLSSQGQGRGLSVQAANFTIGLVSLEASGFINGCVICCLDQKMFCSCRNLAEIWGGDPQISTVTIWTTFWDIWANKSKKLFIAVVHVQIQKYKIRCYQRLL